MNHIKSFFVEDWRRKLLAVGIAFLIWSWVEGQVGMDREVSLTLVLAEGEVRTPHDFELLVEAPEGWVLTEPASGESVPMKLHGSSSELTDFTTRQCAASIKVNLDTAANQDRIDFPLTPEKLQWMRPGDAAFLLRGVQGAQPLQKLTFERIDQAVIVLTHREVPIEGEPSQAHEAQPEKMRFEPSQVTLTGPKFAMEQLRNRIEEAHSANGSIENSGLLSPLTIGSSVRQDIRDSRSLAPDLLKRGIRMDPPRVLVELPIRLKDPTTQTWLPDTKDLIILPADDQASNGPWTIEPWVPTEWVAEMPDVESDLELNRQWIREHIALLLPMHTLTADSLDRESLRIEARLFGLSPEDLRFYQQHLRIHPLVADSATVTVTRTP